MLEALALTKYISNYSYSLATLGRAHSLIHTHVVSRSAHRITHTQSLAPYGSILPTVRSSVNALWITSR